MSKLIDVDEIRKWHQTFKPNGELFEIRLLGDKTFSGYFTDVDTAISAIEPFDRAQIYQIYFTVNEVNPACSSRRQYNQFLRVNGSATSKNDIDRRTFLPIDIDVKRPSDISSTNEEKTYAYEKARDVYEFLMKCGFPQPVICDSSSGYHIYYPADMENSRDTELLVYSFYDVLSSIFTDERVKIDRQVGDANRIMRLPGSWGRKGRDSEERPHRLAHIMYAPEFGIRLTADRLGAFVDKYKVEEERPAYNTTYGGGREPFDLRKFISDHGISVRNETSWGNGGTKFVLEECPFDSSHKAPDSALFLSANGAIGFRCLHDSCQHNHWPELRKMLDPSAYDYKERRQEYAAQNNRIRSPKPAVIKEEKPETGKKWLSLSEVRDINLDDVPRVRTGFVELDNLLGGGLFMGETTIISGINGSGKSAWLNTLSLNAIQDGHNVALWTGELQAPRLKRWIVQAAAGPYGVSESERNPGRFYVPSNNLKRIVDWMEGHFIVYNNDYSSNYAQILFDMVEPTQRGYDLFILDNLFAMDLDGMEGDDNSRQKQLILALASYAKQNNVHIILVAHPRKVVSFLRKEDILGSSALQNAVDNIAIIHRTGRDFQKRATEIFTPKEVDEWMKYGNMLELCKNREYGSIEKMVGLYYDLRSKRFTDGYEPAIRYGWGEEEVYMEKTAVGYGGSQMPSSRSGSMDMFNENEEDAPF